MAADGERRDDVPHWGRPVSGFGDPRAWLLVVGLAPGAKGSNRTGRMFTGDRSADFLVAGLHRAGFANQPTSVTRGDGLTYRGLFLTAAVRCLPPLNQPTPAEARRCRPFLEEEMRELSATRAILALGRFAWDACRASAGRVYGVEVPRTPFSHGVSCTWGPGLPTLWASYHPSPQNTQTGVLTAAMFDDLLTRIRRRAGARA